MDFSKMGQILATNGEIFGSMGPLIVAVQLVAVMSRDG